ncbi:PIN domain-containing protein [Mycolicibacterium flavescens]|uniref:Ribonuclease VapC n=1 Tax=Mycolicibacterium flavescens TaxID=1776 RepID=A0A1E3RLZ3_MYCFV|nr:TA system VapC family ribonuclease toxin [Mycolicibacterium flavescens]MCV7281736.1 PIN domain-containing protein [Mycolicibacterium flavescens]ODQ90868.1 ribonuclease [Mycolicibacterium flavescens]
MTTLLDANVLIALVVADHVHHDRAVEWLAAGDFAFATCPITEGSLTRFLVRAGQPVTAAREVIKTLAAAERHAFWPDSLSYSDLDPTGVVGHRQVTDAYLAALARSRKGQLATFDEGLAQLHRDVAVLVRP